MLRKCIVSTIFLASAAHPLYYSTGCLCYLTAQHTWHSKPHKSLNVNFTYEPIQWNISVLYTLHFKASHIISHISVTSTQGPLLLLHLAEVMPDSLQYICPYRNQPSGTHYDTSDTILSTNNKERITCWHHQTLLHSPARVSLRNASEYKVGPTQSKYYRGQLYIQNVYRYEKLYKVHTFPLKMHIKAVGNI